MDFINNDYFKEVKKGGYDKEDVMNKFNELVNENNSLLKQVKELTDDNYLLKSEIENKYKKYADNYEEIASLVFEAKLRAKEIIAEAEKEKASMIAAAALESEDIISEAQEKADTIVKDGKEQYANIEAKTNALIEKVGLMEKELTGAFVSVNQVAGELDIKEDLDSFDDDDMEEEQDFDLADTSRLVLSEEE